MEKWQPLSRRHAGKRPDGPFEGVPDHLNALLTNWYDEIFCSSRVHRYFDLAPQQMMAMKLRVAVPVDVYGANIRNILIDRALRDPNFFLDLIDATLNHVGDAKAALSLEEILSEGASAWSVNATLVPCAVDSLQ